MERFIVVNEAGEPIELTRSGVILATEDFRNRREGSFRRQTARRAPMVVPFVTRAQAEKIVRRAKTRLGRKYEIREAPAAQIEVPA